MEERKRKSPKRLLIDIPEEIHREIKRSALNKNITLRKWVLRVFLIALKQESINGELP